MEFAVPLPRQNEITGPFSNKWYDFVHSFHSQDISEQFKKSFLMHYGSQTLNNLKNKISDKEFIRLIECLETLENQCLFQIVICFLRHLFFTHCRQGETSFKEFYTELRLLSQLCSFEDDNREDLIKKQLISNIPDESARDVFLSNDKLTAPNIIDVCDLADAQCRKISPELINVFLTDKQQQTLVTNNPETRSKKDCVRSTVLFPTTHDTEMTTGLNNSSLLGSVSDDQCVNPGDSKISIPLPFTQGSKNYCSMFTNSKEIPHHMMVYESVRLAETTLLQPNKLESRAGFNATPVFEPTASCVVPFQISHHQQELILSSESEKDKSRETKNEIQAVADMRGVGLRNNNADKHINATGSCEKKEVENDDDFFMSVGFQEASTNESCEEVDDKIDSNYNDHDSMQENHLLNSTNLNFSKDCYLSEVPSVFISQQSTIFKTSQPKGISGDVLDVFSCNLCKFTSTEKNAIKEHSLRVHSSLKCYVCTSCNSKFSSKYQIESHVRLLHLNIGKQKCQICDKVFSSQSSLLEHLQIHSGHTMISCDVCCATFGSKKLLSKHIFDTHSPRGKWVCRLCRTPFSTRKALSDHVSDAHTGRECDDNNDNKGNRHRCELCDVNFSDVKSKESHDKKFHQKNKSLDFTCDQCDYTCVSKHHLISHLRTHTGEKPYTCEICGRGFSQSSSLEYHTRTHTGEKPYKCQYCDVSFATSSNRLVHERNHRNERPYICEQCGKAYRNSYLLRCHIENHNESKQFVCHCGSAFNTKSKLLRHQKCHLPRKMHTCDTCGTGFTRLENLRGHKQSQACSKKVMELKLKAQT